ncbi:hypothetical protein F4861DRAFT_511044 [Xylaria intraflava]|nr:hypothetical protein F4861DRAFT_511044 [Xylaria intraflava]
MQKDVGITEYFCLPRLLAMASESRHSSGPPCTTLQWLYISYVSGWHIDARLCPSTFSDRHSSSPHSACSLLHRPLRPYVLFSSFLSFPFLFPSSLSLPHSVLPPLPNQTCQVAGVVHVRQPIHLEYCDAHLISRHNSNVMPNALSGPNFSARYRGDGGPSLLAFNSCSRSIHFGSFEHSYDRASALCRFPIVALPNVANTCLDITLSASFGVDHA